MLIACWGKHIDVVGWDPQWHVLHEFHRDCQGPKGRYWLGLVRVFAKERGCVIVEPTAVMGGDIWL